MSDILEITEHRRKELVALSLDESPIHTPRVVKIPKRGRPRLYLTQRMCKCGNLARAKLSLKKIKYWDKRCAACHGKKYKKPPAKVFRLLVPHYVPSHKAYVPRRAKCTLT